MTRLTLLPGNGPGLPEASPMIEHPTRRDMLVGAAAATLAAPAAAAASDETPVVVLYRQYRALDAELEAQIDAALDAGADPDLDAILAPRDALEDRILGEPCRSPADLAAKIAMVTRDGNMLPWESHPLWSEIAGLLVEAGASGNDTLHRASL